MIPDNCSSLICSPPNKHCIKCSHALWFGEVYVNGIRWNFEFNPRFGPVFVNLNGEPKKVQPAENHPVWKEWGKWHDEKFEDEAND